MRYSNVDYNVLYVDPSRSANGNGSTPATAMNALPASASSIPERTCYLVRRTDESKALTLPTGSSSVTCLMILGMPLPADPMWELVPEAAKTAWGSDSAAYANIQATSSSASLQLPSAQQFVLNRVNLFRDNVDAGAYLLRFTNSTEGVGSYSFERCRFGAKGIDVDKASYAGEIAAPQLCGYVYVNMARIVSFTDSVMNHACTGYSSYPHGLSCKWADVMNVRNVKVFSPASTNSSEAYPLFLSDSLSEGIECTVADVEQTVRLNGTSGQYVPELLSVQGYVSMRVRDITVKTGTPLSANRPTSYQVPYPLLRLEGVYELQADRIALEYGDCWDVPSPVVHFSRCYSSTYVPGADKHIRDLSVTLASENGIGSTASYENATSSRSDYAAVILEFQQTDGYVFAKAMDVSKLSVVHPRGKALHAESVRITDSELEGCVNLKACVADLRSVKTWFPGKALNAYEGTHVRCRLLECNTANPSYAYNEDPAVGTGYGDGANVFVDASNTPLRPMASESSRAERIYQGFGCNSEGAEGHFAFRCANGICDTWSVRREGGGAAALKLSNNACSSPGTMVLGRRPFNGMHILPKTTGRHLLRAHVALKGFARPEELYRQLFLSLDVGGRTFYSSVHGRWADDSESVWINDSDLTQLVLEMPFDIAEVGPVDVRVYFSWYSSGGFVYLDPDIELKEVVT